MSRTSTYRSPLGTLTIETSVIDVTSYGPKPDKGWRYTDQHGHEHYWANRPGGYPTLVDAPRPGLWVLRVPRRRLTPRVRRSDPRPRRSQCRLCGEPIVPRMIHGGGFQEFVPGPRRYHLDGRPISEALAKEIMALGQSATPDQDGESPHSAS